MKRTMQTSVDLAPYAALFLDFAAWESGLRHPLSLDYLRIERIVESRGVSFIMNDMPAAGRILDFSLSRGRLNWNDLPKTFGTHSNGRTKLFLSCFFLRLFDESGRLHDDPDPTVIFFLRQALYLSKKVNLDCPDRVVEKAVSDFRKIDESLREPVMDWFLDSLGDDRALKELSFTDGYRDSRDLVSPRDSVPRTLLEVLDRVCWTVATRFPELDYRELRPRHGPGAVADAKSGTDKYLFPHWPRKLEGMFPYSYFAQSREDLHLQEVFSTSHHEPAARLLAVPKTYDSTRLIASEPISHQWMQLSLMMWLRQKLPTPLRPSINFLSQEPSRVACLQASRLGTLGTVDLSSASDRLSCWVVERVFSRNPSILRGLHAARTRTLRNCTGLGDPFFIKLKKFAAQGSGTTFPVQTIAYTCCAIACVLYSEGRRVTSKSVRQAAGKVRVFGDDMIVPSRVVPDLGHLLSYLDLKVNVSKTHYTGHFRESCGIDAFRGYDVTPLYLSDLVLGTSAEALVSWVDVTNNAYTKGLWVLSSYLESKIPVKIRKRLHITNRPLSCLTLRSHLPTSFKKTFYNESLHRDEVLGLVAKSAAVREQRGGYASLLQYFAEEPSPDLQWSAGWTKRTSLRIRKERVPTY